MSGLSHLLFVFRKTKKPRSIWFPAEPPVALAPTAKRRAGGKGAPTGAAKRTLAAEHRCAIQTQDGRRSREPDAWIPGGGSQSKRLSFTRHQDTIRSPTARPPMRDSAHLLGSTPVLQLLRSKGGGPSH
jgi:hypothetical protein